MANRTMRALLLLLAVWIADLRWVRATDRGIEEEIQRLERRIEELRSQESEDEPASAHADRQAAIARLEERLVRLRARLAEPGSDPTVGRGPVETVTVTAPRPPDPLPIEVVGRDAIEQTATVDLQEVLDALPGISVRRNETFGLGASTIRMQGADPDQVAVLLDGAPFVGGIDGVVDLRDLPAMNVDRVEIIRGPGPALYGDRGTAGVINIVTRRPSTGPTVLGTIAGGNLGRDLVNLEHAASWRRFAYSVSGQSSGIRLDDQFPGVSRQFSGEHQDDQQRRNQLRLSSEQAFERSRLRFQGSQVKEDSPFSTELNRSLGLRWEWASVSGTGIQMGAHQHGFHRENNLPGFEEERDYSERLLDVQVARPAGGHAVLPAHGLLAMYQYRREDYDSPVQAPASTADLTRTPVEARLSHHSLRLQDDMTLGARWGLGLGMSADAYDRSEVFLNPRLALSWRPGESWTMSLGAARVAKPANLLQLFDRDVNIVSPTSGYQVVGNPELRPETDRALHAEVGFRRSRISINLRLFRHDFSDLIVTRLTEFQPLTFTYMNVEAARSRGAEADIEVDLLGWRETNDTQDLHLGFNYTHLETESQSDIATEDGKELPFRPGESMGVSLAYAHRSAGFNLKVWANTEGRSFANLSNSIEVPAYRVLNVKLTQRLWGGLSLFLEGNNVTDFVIDDPTGLTRVVGPESYLAGLRFLFGGGKTAAAP